MHFTDQALVLSSRRHAESSGLVRVLTRGHGLCGGMVRGIAGKAARGVWQPGNRLVVTWKARLAEHLGSFTGELVAAHAAPLLHDSAKLTALTSAAALTGLTLAEREPHPELFDSLLHLLHALQEEEWTEAYARFELELLSSCGFRLDLSACAGTGRTHDLIYVSPVTGRAVSREAGEPYKDRLLKLPAFLTNNPDASGKAFPPPLAGEGQGGGGLCAANGKAIPLPTSPRKREEEQWIPEDSKQIEPTEILASLRLSGYFLDAFVLKPHHRSLPAARARLVQMLCEMEKAYEHYL